MKNRILMTLLAIGMVVSLTAMQPNQPLADANGYRYKNEQDVSDKRNIAILSYGSLVNQNANAQTGAKLEASQFSKTATQLPVSLMRESSANTAQRRITAVIDREGDLKNVWVATSKFQFLPNARNNLAAREGAPYRGQSEGYSLDNIFYMKKLLPNRQKDSNEIVIPETDRWIMRVAGNERQQLPMPVAQKVAQWADANGYSAVIWASFAPNISSRAAVVKKLLSDDTLLANTQAYIKNLPDGAQSNFEKAIVGGKDALRTFVVGAVQNIPAGNQPAAQPAVDTERHYKDFVYYQRGDLPILLSAPHGGDKKIPNVPKRTGFNPLINQEVSQFVTVQDDGTLELALKVSDDIYAILGKRPYLVAADFDRVYIDANRAPKAAYENQNAKPIYDLYHGKMKEYVQEIKNRFGNHSILVDIHGQGVDARTVYRGTRGKSTVASLINRVGQKGLTGPDSILGVLANKGYSIYPKNDDSQTAEHHYFSGGYIVGHYGSSNDGIDALQLENGWVLRREARNQFAKDLAEAIAQFYFTFLVE